MSPASLSIIGLILNAIGAFIMLCWPISTTAICFDKNDKKWKLSGNWMSSIVVPAWKVWTARLGP